MPNTITEYTTFVAATKAKASEVNTNFSNYRGTIVPINTDTASASDSTHDLGSSEHQWLNVFGNTVVTDTLTTDSILFNGDTTAGISVESTSTGRLVLKSGNAAAAQGTESGNFISTYNYVEQTISTATITATTPTTIHSITMTTEGGWLEFIFTNDSAQNGTFNMNVSAATSGADLSTFVRILRDNTSTGTTTTVARIQIRSQDILSSGNNNKLVRFAPGALTTISNVNITAGSYVYDLQCWNGNSFNRANFFGMKLIIRET